MCPDRLALRAEDGHPIVWLASADLLEAGLARRVAVTAVSEADDEPGRALRETARVRLEVRGDEVRRDDHVVVDEDHDLADRALDAHVSRLPCAEAEIGLVSVHERQTCREASGDLRGVVG